jgi:LmbE family N-acetylglucosaminyl deacetylase
MGQTPPAGCSLLAVFAHPDDESLASGGLLARCADEGIRTSLLCFSRGGLGALDDVHRLHMGESRARELRAAARELGIADVTLLDYRNGFLPWVGRAELEHDILSAITRAQADVVITFDEDGLYWHPDHIVLHERTKATVARMGEEAPALYYVSMPRGSMRAAWTAAADGRACGANGTSVPPVVMGVEVDAFGLFTKPPTLTLDVSAFAVRKLHALRCHRSQVAGDALDHMPDEAAPCVLGAELYRRADVGASRETFLDRMGGSVRT